MSFTLANILLGVVCIVVVSVLFAGFQSYVYDPPLPGWIEQAVVTAVAVVIWFGLASKVNR
jgi:hypothetical protein